MASPKFVKYEKLISEFKNGVSPDLYLEEEKNR